MPLSQNISIAFLAGAALSFASAASAADAARGAKVYEEQGCSACHAPKETLVGPPHCGVFGRKAGTVPGYAYSAVMQGSGLTWDEKTLNDFISAPLAFLSGTNMGFAGLYDEKDRADLIAFLKQGRAAASPACK